MSGGWTTTIGDGPVIATAIHHGHNLRDELLALTKLDDAARLREEDPFTGRWAARAPTHLIVETSRFEVDLNRPRAKAVYREPDDAWGLDLWRTEPSTQVIDRSLRMYDQFYRELEEILEAKVEAHGKFALLDIHAYNYRRLGPDAQPEAQNDNPDINIGTGSMERDRWTSVVDGLMREMRRFDRAGRKLDVRENVRFRGGELPRWIHRSFPNSGCAIAVELKKTFMNEWTGEADQGIIQAYEEMTRGLVELLEAVLR